MQYVYGGKKVKVKVSYLTWVVYETPPILGILELLCDKTILALSPAKSDHEKAKKPATLNG